MTGPVGAHVRFRLLAAAAVDGRVSTEEAEELEAHLMTCATCRADQAAMLRDHQWLAVPSRVTPPDPRVRATVLRAALANPITRTSPWLNLAAACLVIAVGLGALALTSRRDPGLEGILPSASPTASATGPSPSTGIPAGTFGVESRAQFEPISGSGTPLGIDLRVVGGIAAPPTGTLAATEGEVGWLGSLASTSYWRDPDGAAVAFVQGCKSGPTCLPFALELRDAGSSPGSDEAWLSFPTSLAQNPYLGQVRYRLASGSLTVSGPLPQLPTRAIFDPAAPDVTAYAHPDGTFTNESDHALAIDLRGSIDGGRAQPAGELALVDDTGTSFTFSISSADYWHDETGQANDLGAYVALLQGCVQLDGCRPVALMLVDAREIGGLDRAGLSWGWVRPTGDAGANFSFFSLADGGLDIGGCMATVVNGAMTFRDDPELCDLP